MVAWHIGTFARIRPPRSGCDTSKFSVHRTDHADGKEGAIITFPSAEDDDDQLSMKQRDSLQFPFDNVYGPESSQQEIFDTICNDLVVSVLSGYNATILAYGQTGSGKTFTMTGGDHYRDRGILARTISRVFQEIEHQPRVKYACYISYMEIYNENVYDLLDSSHANLPIEEWNKVLLMDDDERELHFRNLSVYETKSEEQALKLMFMGNMNRITSETPMNQASSRSHAVFCIMIKARSLDSDVLTTSKLHLVDLAGSERVYKHQNSQRMRREGTFINLSLHHLENVIVSLRAQKKTQKTTHIPYRNSMLTSVLRSSLGGNCKSVFIATLNPEAEFIDESISTCRFMQRCSEIVVNLVVNQEIDAHKRVIALEKLRTKLEAEREKLRARVIDLEAQNGALLHDKERWKETIEENRVLLSRLEEQDRTLCRWSTKSSLPEIFDWNICQELVEKLDVSSHCESDQELFDQPPVIEMTQEIWQLGMKYAIGCLIVSKENLISTRNMATELQEASSKQQLTIESLEKQLSEQKLETLQLQKSLEQCSDAFHPSGTRQLKLMRSPSLGTSKNPGRDKLFSVQHSDSEDDTSISGTLIDKETEVQPLPRTFSTSDGEMATSSELLMLHLVNGQDTGKSNAEHMHHRLQLLRNGALFIKFGRYGKPHVRFVWLSNDFEYLSYRYISNEVPKAVISTRSIRNVLLGQQTKVFERAIRKDLARKEAQTDLCFSIEYETNRTLDLEVLDGDSIEAKRAKRNEWVETLRFLIKIKTVSQKE
uniref:Kinesin-like protein n=1 Tax=Albugo laibachii Nc14 TaxID=890382 RepID=F0X2B0_9STRA|nr:kinesinlike protein putative [Albugo laibachii Nc14]|eukprot:CCA27991.1 kinesinlike protein putative [Albugo laibachii Nc14]